MSIWHLHRCRVMLVALRGDDLGMGSRSRMAQTLPSNHMLLTVMTLNCRVARRSHRRSRMDVICPNHARLVRRICRLPPDIKTATCTLALDYSILNLQGFFYQELFLGVFVCGVGGFLIVLVIFEIVYQFVVDFLLFVLVR